MTLNLPPMAGNPNPSCSSSLPMATGIISSIGRCLNPKAFVKYVGISMPYPFAVVPDVIRPRSQRLHIIRLYWPFPDNYS